MIYVLLLSMSVIGVLAVCLRTYIKKLEQELLRVQLLDKELITLRKQNATLTEAAKSYNPTYDIDKLFTGGF